jgi:hypothetical protein
MRLLLAIGLSVFSASCDAGNKPRYDAEPTVVRGYYRYADGFDHLPTISVGIENESLCVYSGVALDQGSDGQPTFVVLEGHLSQRGSFGYMGECARMLRVTRVVEVRDPTPAEIESLGAFYEAQRALDCAGSATAEQPAGYCQ